MSVHAGAKRNVCIIKVSTETPQSTTNPSQAAPHLQTSTLTPVSPTRLPQPLAQPFAQVCYRCRYQVSSTAIWVPANRRWHGIEVGWPLWPDLPGQNYARRPSSGTLSMQMYMYEGHLESS